MAEPHPLLGARPSATPPGEQPERYQLRRLLKAEPPLGELPTSRFWNDYLRLSQKGPSCTGNGALYSLVRPPFNFNPVDLARALARSSDPEEAALAIYFLAQHHDEFEDTPPAGGSSAQGVGEALLDLALIGSYVWDQGVEGVARCLLTKGPVLLATTWLNSMFDPVLHTVRPGDRPRFVLNVNWNSGVAGGHLYCADGVNTRFELVRFVQSWPLPWGFNGHAYIRFEDLERLLAEQGEAVHLVP